MVTAEDEREDFVLDQWSETRLDSLVCALGAAGGDRQIAAVGANSAALSSVSAGLDKYG